jgi:hypothetical protein
MAFKHKKQQHLDFLSSQTLLSQERREFDFYVEWLK